VAFLTGISGIVDFIAGFFGSLQPRARLTAALGGVIMLGMAVLFVVIIVTTRHNAFEIQLNGEFIGIAEMRSNPNLDADAVMALVLQRLVNEVTEPVDCSDTIQVISIRSNVFRDLDQIVAEIARNAAYRVQVAIITINGEEIVTLRNINEAERLLDEIRNDFAVHGDERTVIFNDFIENVQIINKFMDVSARMSYAHARSILTTQERVPDVHIVQSRQTLSYIWNLYGMSQASIMELNPGIRPDNLSIGQSINVLRPKPMLSVRTVVALTYEEVVPFGTEFHDDPERSVGYRNTVIHGKDGLKRVTDHLIYENGILISREEAHWVYIEEPMDEQVVRGTRR